MWQVTGDMWHMTCDMWHLTCDTWHVTCNTWLMPYIYFFFLLFSLFSISVLSVSVLVSSENSETSYILKGYLPYSISFINMWRLKIFILTNLAHYYFYNHICSTTNYQRNTAVPSPLNFTRLPAAPPAIYCYISYRKQKYLQPGIV